jgi:hypothetical protein
MPIEPQTISLPFSAGVDTKTDPKMLDAPKLVTLQDCVFNRPQSVSKRNGYDAMTKELVGGGTWSNPVMCKSYRDEQLIAATTSNGQRLLSYSPDLNAWQDKGKYISVGVSREDIAIQQVTESIFLVGLTNTSSIVSGNLSLFCFENAPSAFSFGSASTQSYITILDNTTGVKIVDAFPVPNSTGYTKAALLGASTFAVFYISNTASNRLVFRIISISAGGGFSLGAEITIGTCAGTGTGSSDQFLYAYDVANTATGAIVAMAAQPNIDLFTVTTSGVVSSATVITSTGTISPLIINMDSLGNAWIYWANFASSVSHLNYAVYSSALSIVLAASLVFAASLADTLAVQQLAALSTSVTAQTLYFSIYQHSGAAIDILNTKIQYYPVTIGGPIVTSQNVLTYNADILGRPFTVGSRSYLPVVTLSNSQSTGFLIDLLDSPVPLAVAKFLQTDAGTIYTPGPTIGGTPNSAGLIAGRYPGFINYPQQITSTLWSFATERLISDTILTYTSATNLDAYPNSFIGVLVMGSTNIFFDFNDVDANQGLTQTDTLILNGGIVSMYDGAATCELGFNVGGDNVGLTPTTGSYGTLVTGSYVYYLTYEWIDGNGNLYQSSPSLPITAIFGSAVTTGIVTINAPFPTLSSKVGSNCVAKLWRSTSDESGVLAYLITTVQYLPGISSGSFTYVDNGSAGLESLYTQGGAILENIAPPPSLILWENNNRVWCVDSENPSTTIEYSKTESAGTGISFSTGQLEYLVDAKFGNITGASALDQETIILKAGSPAFFYGDGANDAGQGQTLTPLQFIPSDCGCVNSKSVVSYPGGLLYKTPKGIYQVSRGFQISYFGVDVAGYNSQDIQSAFIVPNKTQIRFLTSSGFSLLYDYVFGHWSVFTNHTGLSADSFGGNYAYVRTDGNVYIENQGITYLDNGVAINPILVLSWIKASTIQGFQRTRRVALLGDFAMANNGHGVQISAAYDFVPTFSAPVPYFFNGTNTVYQYRERLDRQKCDAFQLMIQEITTGASGENITFSDLALEIMAKTGISKLPGAQSVG